MMNATNDNAFFRSGETEDPANQDEQLYAGNYLAALARAFGGRRVGHEAFIDKVELVLAGSRPNLPTLMQFTGDVRRTGLPLIWVAASEETPLVPAVGLVCCVDGRTHVIENCALWMSAGGSRVWLVPDSFEMGAFRFDRQLRLRYVAKAPVDNAHAPEVGMIRAYTHLRELQREQMASNEGLRLPSLVTPAWAA